MEALSWIRRETENNFEITANVLGPGEGMENEIRVLNGTLGWTDSGITYEPDQRHAEIHHQRVQPFRKQQERKGATQISTMTFKPSWHSSSSRQSRGIARKGLD